jgi:hypothetical protein
LMEAGIEYPRMFNAAGEPPVNALGERLTIELHYLSGPAWPNALIRKIGSTRCAAVFDSTILSMIEIARYIFSRSAIFPWIGAASGEHDVKVPLNYPIGLGSLHTTANKYSSVYPAITPRCPIRHSLSDLFVKDMLQYVWFHELVHGAEGHADLFAVSRAIPLCESYDPRFARLVEARSPKLNRQMMEIAADEGALRLLLDPVYLDIRTVRLKEEFGLSREQWAGFILLAIIMTSFLWCQVDVLRDKKNLKTLDRFGLYPVSSFRLWDQILLAKSLAAAQRRRFDEIETGIELTMEALRYLACEEEQFRILVWLFENSEKHTEFAEYRAELSKKATLSAQLAKYRFRASD